MKAYLQSFGKETAAYVLAAIILFAWLATIFLRYDEVSTLTNVVMIVVGYIWGSSTGSKRKDDAFIPPVPDRGSTTTETTTKTEASTASPSAANPLFGSDRRG